MKIDKRDFLKGAALTGAAFTASGLLGPIATGRENRPPTGGTSPLTAAPAPEGVTRTTFLEAEKIMGVPFSDSERDLLVETIGAQIEEAEALRGLAIKNDGPAPALTFDPRVPGTRMPRALWRPSNASPPPLPSSDTDIAFAPLTRLAGWIKSGQLGSRRLTEIYLRRIERLVPKLECMVTVTADLALRQADRADREIAAGKYRGPLHGIPFGAKDLLDTRDIATTWGAMPYKDRVATRNARVIDLLEAQGAVLLGKTTMGALAYGDLWFGGLTRNPWNPEEGASGSSAGSGSSVAAGLMAFALGTETLGSIASPSTRNGVVGLRPTFGRVSRSGAMALCWSMDKIGPMCRSVEDAILVLGALNGADADDPSTVDAPLAFDAGAQIQGRHVGFVPAWFEGEDVPAAAREALGAARRLGLELVEIDLPDLPYGSMILILIAEAAASMEELTLSGRDDLLRGQTGNAWPNIFRRARLVSAVDLVQLQRFRRQVMNIMHEKFDGLDAIIGPSLATPMLPITNYTGHPALTIRAGFIESEARRSAYIIPEHYGPPPSGKKFKVPVSVTLWGPLYEDGAICRIGMALERELGVQHMRPPMAV